MSSTNRYSTVAKRYLRFSSSLSMVFSIFVLLINFYRLSLQWTPLSLLYTGVQLLLSLLAVYIQCSIQKNDTAKPWHKVAGYVLMLSVLLGNPFNFVSGMMLIFIKVQAFQIYLSFSVLVDLSAITVSLLNLAKPTLSPTYTIGMVVLSLSLLIHWGLALLSPKLSILSSRTLYIIISLLIVTAFTGNILSLFAAWLLYRVHSQEGNQSRTSVLANVARHEVAVFGMYIIVFILTMAIVSYLTFEYSYAVENNYTAILQSPNIMYPLGTDNFGRDVFSRMIFGGRISLLVGVLATIMPLLIGGFLGAMAAYYSDQLDHVIMRLLDVLYAIPGILLAITIVTAFGTSTQNLILALSIGGIPAYARTMRASVFQVKLLEYVEAARAVGVSDSKIILKHIIPNASAPMIIRASMTVATAVISTSSLSYLGLGVESHIPEWGNILRIGSDYLETQPYLAIYPGLAIIALVLSFNFLGDGLRDALDPKMNS